MWTSSARESSPVHAATVASSPTSTTGSTYPPARCLTSTSAKSRPGPATNPASMPSRSVPRRWRNVRSARPPHTLTDGFTDTDRPARGGSRPQGTSWRLPSARSQPGRATRPRSVAARSRPARRRTHTTSRPRPPRLVGALDAIEPVQRERDRLDSLVDVVQRPEVVQPGPATDHRDGVQPSVEPGVGEQLAIAEERQGSSEFSLKNERRTCVATRLGPAAHRHLEVGSGAIRVGALLLCRGWIVQGHCDAAQFGEELGETGVRWGTKRRHPRRHHAGRFDPGQQLPRPTVSDREAGTDLRQRRPVHGGVCSRLDRSSVACPMAA